MDKYATHVVPLSLLLAEVPEEAVVIEFGGGKLSTPLFNAFAMRRNLYVRTYESEASYFRYLKRYENERHEVTRITAHNWERLVGDVQAEEPYFVFVDLGNFYIKEQDETVRVNYRNKILQRLLPFAQVLICHDTEEGTDDTPIYAWNFDAAKYIKHFVDFEVRTTVCSNFVDVSRIEYVDGA